MILNRRRIVLAILLFIALMASFVLNHTRRGLHLRAVGENPVTADSAGIHVELVGSDRCEMLREKGREAE